MPAVIFMDEPTSGLDGAAALQLVQACKRLRESGLTIICVIHQPRLSVFEAFTHVLLLGRGGQTVYCGVGAHIEKYFNSHGFTIPARENAADWIIDITCGLASRQLPNGDTDQDFVAPRDLFKLWQDVEHDSKCKNEFHEGYVLPPVLDEWTPVRLKPRTKIGRTKQTYYLFSRSLRQHNQQLFVSVCIAVMLGSVTFANLHRQQHGYNLLGSSQWLTGSLGYLLSTLLVAAYFQTLIGSERLTFRRELRSGISSIAYWYSKNLHSMLLVPLVALAASLGPFLVLPPRMPYGPYYASFLMAFWYWSGASMMVTVATMDQFKCSLLLIFWPLGEVVWEGQPGLGSNPRKMAAVSWFAAGRWVKQAQMAVETKYMSEAERSFGEMNREVRGDDDPSLHERLHNRMINPDALDLAQVEALMVLFAFGTAFRLAALGVLLWSKYLPGTPPLSLISPVLSKLIAKANSTFFGVTKASLIENDDPDAAELQRDKKAESQFHKEVNVVAQQSAISLTGISLKNDEVARSADPVPVGLKWKKAVPQLTKPNEGARSLLRVLELAQAQMQENGLASVDRNSRMRASDRLSGMRASDCLSANSSASSILRARADGDRWAGTVAQYLERRGGMHDAARLQEEIAQIPGTRLRIADEHFWRKWLVARGIIAKDGGPQNQRNGGSGFSLAGSGVNLIERPHAGVSHGSESPSYVADTIASAV